MKATLPCSGGQRLFYGSLLNSPGVSFGGTMADEYDAPHVAGEMMTTGNDEEEQQRLVFLTLHMGEGWYRIRGTILH